MESCLTDPQWKWKELSGTVRGPGYTLESGRSLHIAMVNVCDVSHTLTWKQGKGLQGCSQVLYPLGFGC